MNYIFWWDKQEQGDMVLKLEPGIPEMQSENTFTQWHG